MDMEWVRVLKNRLSLGWVRLVRVSLTFSWLNVAYYYFLTLFSMLLLLTFSPHLVKNHKTIQAVTLYCGHI